MDPDVQPNFKQKLAAALYRAANTLSSTDSEDALLQQLDHADRQDVIDQSQKEMITNIIELADVNAGDIMTHRMEMVAVEENSTCRQAVQTALESGYSRLPIYRKTVDDVVGFLYAKDLLNLFTHPEAADEPVLRFMHTAMFVPESRGAQELLLDFKRNRTMIAVVVDEYGGTAGLVSMEDILEEIVGNIQDEYDDEEDPLIACENGYIADGALALEDVYDAFDLPMPEREDEDEHDSVGGLVVNLLGRIPKAGETVQVELGGLTFVPEVIGERRVEKVRCTRTAKQPLPNTL